MSKKTPFEQVVIKIMEALDAGDSLVPYYVGAEHLAHHGEQRRIVFVPTSGRFKQAKGGTKEVEPLEKGTLLSAIPLTVQAHVFTECFECSWLLWQNLLNATGSVLQVNNTNVSFNWPQSAPESATDNARTICVVQTFEWELQAWEGIIPMPVGDCNVETFVLTKRMQTMLTYKKTGRLVTDPNEPL